MGSTPEDREQSKGWLIPGDLDAVPVLSRSYAEGPELPLHRFQIPWMGADNRRQQVFSIHVGSL